MSAVDAASLNFWESLADWGTWLVIIGVVGEGLEIALKIGEHKIKNERFLSWCKRHSFSIEIWGCIFWMMVVVGLLMEHRGNQRAQILVKTENSRITKELGEANGRAGDAIKQAGEANERAGNAVKQAADSNERAANAQSNIEKLRKEAGEANERASVAELKRVELEKQVAQLNIKQAETEIKLKQSEKALADSQAAAAIAINAASTATNAALSASSMVKRTDDILERAKSSTSLPRHLTEIQRKSFIELTKNAPKGTFGFDILTRSPEAYAYAREIRSLLSDAGYDASPENAWGSRMLFGVPPPTGLTFVIANPDSIPPFAGPALLALKKVGIEFSAQANPREVREGAVMVIVGEK